MKNTLLQNLHECNKSHMRMTTQLTTQSESAFARPDFSSYDFGQFLLLTQIAKL